MMHFLFHVFHGSEGQDPLKIHAGPEGNLTAVLFHDLRFIHGVLLYRMQHIESRFNELIQQRHGVATAVQPHMESF